MPEVNVKLVFEKENKNSIRFKEVPEPGKAEVLGSIYLQIFAKMACWKCQVD